MLKQKDRDIMYNDDLQNHNAVAENDLEDQEFLSQDVDSKSLFYKVRYWRNRMRQHPNYRKYTQYLLIALFFVVANVSYLSTNQPCPFLSDAECGSYFYRPLAPVWLSLIEISAIFFSMIIFFAIHYKLGSRIFALLGFLNLLYLSYFHDNTFEHGIYGRELGHVLWVFTIFTFILFHISWAIYFCYRKRKTLTLVLVPLTLVLFILGTIGTSCRGWTEGLDGEKINQDIGCKVDEPFTCIYEIHGSWTDLNWWLRYECKNHDVHPELIKLYYPHTPYVGFARTERLPKMMRNAVNLSVAVHESLIPLQSMEEERAKDVEIFLETKDFKDPNLIINVKRNETLVKERAKLQKKKGLTKNLLLVFLDTVSRRRSLVNYKKTMSWFEAFMNKKNPNKETFQFFKFHSITPYTPGNVFAMLYNKEFPASPLPQEKPNYSIYKTFKENGYIVGHSVTICDVSHLNVIQVKNLVNYLTEVPPDHEGVSFPCDPTHDINRPTEYQGRSSLGRRCLYKKDVHEYTLEYGDQFWRKYANERKVLHLDFGDNHEGTAMVGTYMDDNLYNFFSGLEKDNLLEDTSIVFVSDHGLHVAFQWQQVFDQKRIENSLPFLYLVLPSNISQKYRVQIKENQQKFSSMWEVHHFLMTFIEGENYEHLDKGLIGNFPADITCDDIKHYDNGCYCNYPEK